MLLGPPSRDGREDSVSPAAPAFGPGEGAASAGTAGEEAAAVIGPAEERSLFRFSSDVLPSWLPIPSFSFEVVQRQGPPPGVGNAPPTRPRPLAPMRASPHPPPPRSDESTISQIREVFPQV
jgi:hypothetical protein